MSSSSTRAARAGLGLLVAAVIGSGSAQARGPSCDRACLTAAAGRAISALMSGDASEAGFAPGLTFTENGRPAKVGASQLKGARPGPYRHDFADVAQGAAGVYATASEPDRMAVYSLRLKVSGGRIVELETVVAHKGEASIASPETLTKPPYPGVDDVVPAARRTPPNRMIAAANAYFDGIEAADGSKVPATPTCNRFENGAQTTNRGGVDTGGCKGLSRLDYIKKVRDRRYPIVDVERGLVWGLVMFDIPGGPSKDPSGASIIREPRSILIGELFKLDAGQIQTIEVVMRNTPLGASPGWR